MTTHIAIIGAGMAGLAAARRLAAAGHSVTLFDKSRGLGGRMATRRVDALRFDHGAQYFTARGARFREQVATWLAQGQVAEWFEGAFVGTPGMTAPARMMAAGLATVTGCQIATLARGGRGWRLHAAEGSVATPDADGFDVVILAVPAPQAIPLAASAGVALPGVERVRYAPCWALMLGYDGPVLADTHLRPSDDAVAWIARNASKPGRDAGHETVVVHATPAWSRAHLEVPPEIAAAALLARFEATTGVSRQPGFVAAHRWRYALVEQPLGEACIWHEDVGLGACGDWCLGPRIEAAFDSGEAVAQAVLGKDGRHGG